MRHPLHFDRSYNAEMLRNKVRLRTERVTDAGTRDAKWRETPGRRSTENDAFPPNVTRTS
jgi:hypothetical protein